MFPDLLGPLEPDWATDGLPGPVKSLVRFVGTPERSRYFVGPLVAGARAAHTLKLEGPESAAYQLARRIELQAGTQSALTATDPTGWSF